MTLPPDPRARSTPRQKKARGLPDFPPGLLADKIDAKQEDWIELQEPKAAFQFAAKRKGRAWRPRGKRSTIESSALFAAIPRHWDWREHAALAAPMHQASCNCCTAFAFATVMTDLATIRAGQQRPSLSPGHLHWCLGGCNCPSPLQPNAALGALITTPLAIHVNGDYPFNPAACPAAHGVLKLKGATNLYTPNDAVRALGKGPIFAVMDLYEDFWSTYGGGIYRHRAGKYLNTHSIAIVGYDADTSCWIVKNSEGTSWGEGGYARIAFGECRIFTTGGHGGLMLDLG